ncbi:MAG: hypothetical protein V4725_05405 [Bacteroidota bacterium]
MNLDLFKESLLQQAPLPGSSVYQQALWYVAKNNWDEAHTLVQDLDDANAAWIHGYLHWQEGDISNADYWYRRASRKRPSHSLQEELNVMVSSIT